MAENLGYQRVRRAAVWRNTGGPPRILPEAIVSSAAMLVEPVAPGELVSLFGTDLGPANGVSNEPDGSGHYSIQLGGVQVLFNGIPGPVLYAQASQVNTVVPFGIAANSTVTVQVSYGGETSGAVSVATAAIAPEVFQVTPPPRAGQAAALNQDGTINSTSNPAALRSIVVLYATGAGVFQPLLQDGVIVSDITAKPVVPVSVVIAGQLADLLYAGPAPGAGRGRAADQCARSDEYLWRRRRRPGSETGFRFRSEPANRISMAVSAPEAGELPSSQ